MKLDDLKPHEWTRENIEKCDAECSSHRINGEYYRRDEATGLLKYDEQTTIDTANRERERREHLDALWFALRSRVLTTEEMSEVERLDYNLLIRYSNGTSGSYNQAEMEKRFNEGLLQQLRLRHAVEVASK